MGASNTPPAPPNTALLLPAGACCLLLLMRADACWRLLNLGGVVVYRVLVTLDLPSIRAAGVTGK